jgi:uncharacterized protein (TIGR00255 family)
VRGVIDVSEASDDDEAITAAGTQMLATLDQALDEILAMRGREGGALQAVLGQRLDRIKALTQAAEDCPGRRPEAVKARLEQAVANLLGSARGLDPERLHQEAILLAGKAEELDRLHAHVAAGRELIAAAAPVGRKLDFLAQEFGREANTLCSKSNDVELTRIGMELRVEIEQFREQVQNIE